MNNENRIHSLDYLKMLCSVLIVALHTVSNTGIGWYFNLLGRMGVPIFAVCSGFLIGDKIFNRDSQSIIKYVTRLLKIEVLWSCLYLYFDRQLYFDGKQWYKILYNIIIVFWRRGIGFHLWYLSSTVICVVLIYVMASRFPLKVIAALGGLMYLFCLLGDNYHGLIVDSPIFPIVNSYIIRNGAVWNSFLSIFIFITLGVILRYRYKGGIIVRPHPSIILICFICFILENVFLDNLHISNGNSASFFLVPLAYYIVAGGVFCKIKRPMKYPKVQLYVYLSHVACMYIIDSVRGYSGELSDSFFRFVLVLGLAYIFSMFLCKIMPFLNRCMKDLMENKYE